MKIYGVNLSPFVRKVLAVCSIKGLDYEHESTMPATKTPEYLAISPLGKVPAMVDGDLKVSDSSIICEYLEETHPQIPVLPANPVDRARARWLEEFADSKFVESVAPYFFENIIKPMMGMGEPDKLRLEKLATEEIPALLEYVESQVPEAGFLFGNIGTADVALCSPLINGAYGGFVLDTDRYPKTAAFLQRVKEHPAMVPVLAAEATMLEAMTS